MTDFAEKQMRIILFYSPVGRITAAWRRDNSPVDEFYGVDLAKKVALQAEAAKVHAMFLAENLTFGSTGKNPNLTGFEPITLMAALAAVTTEIGIIGTASTTFIEPYHVARYFSALDHLSKGRVGWNVVTSFAGEENFGVELPSHDERYRRAYEHLRVCKALWDAWSDDAIVLDREKGVWADPDRIVAPNVSGEFYDVAGPLILPRSPQGWPVIVQAGSSDVGIEFAAHEAEVVFTAQTELAAAKEFRRRVQDRASALGRGGVPNVLPGLVPILGNTEEEANEIHDELISLLDLDALRTGLSRVLQDARLDDLGLDEPIPAERLIDPDALDLDAHQGTLNSRYRNYFGLAVQDRAPLRRLLQSFASDGHGMVAGTAETVADHMEEWFSSGACDGFAISPTHVPEGVDAVCEQLIPELQRRGLFRKDYEGATLRENLGLERPAGRTAVADG